VRFQKAFERVYVVDYSELLQLIAVPINMFIHNMGICNTIS